MKREESGFDNPLAVSSGNQRPATVVRVLVGILLGCVVLAVSANIVMVTQQAMNLPESRQWILAVIQQTGMFVLSIILILVLSRGRVSTYGFKWPENLRLKPVILWSLGVGILGAAIQSLLPASEHPLTKVFSFPQVVIFVWIYASICEEVFTRGLILGYLAPLSRRGITMAKLHLSLPVMVAAIFFGLMHLMLLTTGMAVTAVLVTVVFAIILGIIAGYHRERTGSLIPAFIVHALFNISGTAIDYAAKTLQ